MPCFGATRTSRASTRGQRDAREDEPGGELAGDVLDRVDREVRAAREERLFDLLDEQPLAADLGERSILDLVAAGDDLLFDELEAGRLAAEGFAEGAALREREEGFARGVDESRHVRGENGTTRALFLEPGGRLAGAGARGVLPQIVAPLRVCLRNSARSERHGIR